MAARRGRSASGSSSVTTDYQRRLAGLGLVLAFGTACATPGTRPHDMSVAHHEEAAGAEEERAAALEGPALSGCTSSASAPDAPDRPCWTGEEDPTPARRAEADRHREAAAAHRAAAQTLRDAEARECVGLSDADRDQSPFSHREDLASVTELTEEVRVGRSGTSPRVVGATIVVRAVPGLTAEWLERVLECHLARNASLGHDVPEMPYCPLVPAGVTVRVRSVGDGFAVDVRADGDEAAAEVLRRARLLLP